MENCITSPADRISMGGFRDCGGLAVICCPNGCMGNYVRFDEPRWAELPGNVLQLELNEKDVIF
ncbi:MAG: hypothetical protein J5494_04810, partial [Candidatus Methanomethylophilaceae archaeon]|nr:hypothetical protein [Candidatus Methanomethylophilaceae archaeon]